MLNENVTSQWRLTLSCPQGGSSALHFIFWGQWIIWLCSVCILVDFQLWQPGPDKQNCTLILFCSWHSTIIPGITWGLCMFVFPARLEAPGAEKQYLFTLCMSWNSQHRARPGKMPPWCQYAWLLPARPHHNSALSLCSETQNSNTTIFEIRCKEKRNSHFYFSGGRSALSFLKDLRVLSSIG